MQRLFIILVLPACVVAAPSVLQAATIQSKFVSQGDRLIESGAATASIGVGTETANNSRPGHVASIEIKQAKNFLMFKMDAHFFLVLMENKKRDGQFAFARGAPPLGAQLIATPVPMRN